MVRAGSVPEKALENPISKAVCCACGNSHIQKMNFGTILHFVAAQVLIVQAFKPFAQIVR